MTAFWMRGACAPWRRGIFQTKGWEINVLYAPLRLPRQQ